MVCDWLVFTRLQSSLMLLPLWQLCGGASSMASAQTTGMMPGAYEGFGQYTLV